MLKVKHERDCDCVVAGFRWHKKVIAPLWVHCSWDSSTMPVPCNMLAFARVSVWRSGGWQILKPYRKDALRLIRGAWAEEDSATDEGVKRMPGSQSR